MDSHLDPAPAAPEHAAPDTRPGGPADPPAHADASVYDSGGSRPALVLLHGIGGTWHIWKPVIPLLEARHRVVALTLPGHHGGEAYTASGPATVAGLAEQVIAILHARGIGQAHVAGNSLGGWLAVELARRGFARSVVALSPAGVWERPQDYQSVAGQLRTICLLLPLMLFLTGWLLGWAALRRLLCAKSMQHGDRIPPDELRDSLRAMARTPVMPALLQTMGRDGPVAPFHPQVPVTIAWSEHDHVIPFERYGRDYPRRVTGARAVTVTGVGHVPMYDDPAQVARHILEQTATAAAPAAA